MSPLHFCLETPIFYFQPENHGSVKVFSLKKIASSIAPFLRGNQFFLNCRFFARSIFGRNQLKKNKNRSFVPVELVTMQIILVPPHSPGGADNNVLIAHCTHRLSCHWGVIENYSYLFNSRPQIHKYCCCIPGSDGRECSNRVDSFFSKICLYYHSGSWKRCLFRKWFLSHAGPYFDFENNRARPISRS